MLGLWHPHCHWPSIPAVSGVYVTLASLVTACAARLFAYVALGEICWGLSRSIDVPLQFVVVQFALTFPLRLGVVLYTFHTTLHHFKRCTVCVCVCVCVPLQTHLHVSGSLGLDACLSCIVNLFFLQTYRGGGFQEGRISWGNFYR